MGLSLSGGGYITHVAKKLRFYCNRRLSHGCRFYLSHITIMPLENSRHLHFTTSLSKFPDVHQSVSGRVSKLVSKRNNLRSESQWLWEWRDGIPFGAIRHVSDNTIGCQLSITIWCLLLVPHFVHQSAHTEKEISQTDLTTSSLVICFKGESQITWLYLSWREHRQTSDRQMVRQTETHGERPRVC